jgi:hypothetical protein
MNVKTQKGLASAPKNKTGDWTSKKLPWFVAWGVIIVVCIAIGIGTRMSYTDFASYQEALMNLRYFYLPYSTEEATGMIEDSKDSINAFISPEQLIDKAGLIIECEFTGQREYSYQSFLSQVRVLSVLKGDKSLAGMEIPVFEPLSIRSRDASMLSSGPKDIEALAGRFGYSEGSPFHQVEVVQGAYFLGGTLMAESNRYVLFLKKREYSEAEDRSSKQDEYVLLDSFYAKLRTEPLQNPESYSPPETNISVADSLSYEILARDSQSARQYFETRDKLLQSLLGK